MSYLYIKLKKVDAVLVKRRINGAKSKSHLFFFASAFLSQSIPCCSSITILHIYIYIYIYCRVLWEKKSSFWFLQCALRSQILKKDWRQLGIIHKQACVIKLIHFFLVRLIVHIRLWYASLDDRASERKRNLHKTHFKNMPPNFWCNI